ncbi:MAG: hypothetical protein ACREOO_24835 [bacterium]
MKAQLYLSLVAASALWYAPGLFAQTATRQDTLAELSRRIDVLTEEIEKVRLGEAAERRYEGKYGMGPAASQVYQIKKTGVSLAGYGEVTYQDFSQETDQGNASGRTNEIDFLRLIVYTGFRFNQRLLFNAEIEFEHGSTASGRPGEVSVEFGYVEAMLTPVLNARAGMLLTPVGIINEYHEPPTYFGVLRPETESQIIPTTWRGNGAGIVGASNNGLGYKLYVLESLYAARFSSSGIRSGRQFGARAIAEDFALTGRLDYSGIPGLNFGASFFTGNTGQGIRDAADGEINARVNLISAHALLSYRGLEARALYARSTIGDVDSLNSFLDVAGSQSVGESQEGFYATLGYNILSLFKPTSQAAIYPFIQYEKLNTQKEVPAGFSLDPSKERTNITYGLSYKPHPNVAFKLDYVNRDNEAGNAVNQFNLAVTYLY